MTSEGAAANQPMSDGLTVKSISDGINWIDRTLRPNQGWVAAGLLVANLIVIVMSVERADWVPSPNLVWLLIISMLTGLFLYRIQLWSIALVPIGFGVGLVVIFWQLSIYSIDNVEVSGVGEVLTRLNLWLTSARDGSINIDKLPFIFVLMVSTWITGFLGSWLFLRFRNFWGVFVLGGIGLLSNLTFLPPNTAFYLAMYLFTALLLVARVQAIRRKQEWEERSIKVDDHLAGLSLSDSFGITGAVILIAFLLPVAPKWDVANDAYEVMRKPLATMEADFNRLFAGLPARRPLGFRIWDDVMAFQGSIYPTTTHVLWVDSPVEMYWKARTYGTYSGQGWISDHTVSEPLGYKPDFTLPRTDRQREEVTYSVTPLYESKKLFYANQVLQVDRDVMIETQVTPVYNIDLQEPDSSLPRYLQELADSLLGEIEREGALLSDQKLALSLPPEFRLDKVHRLGGRPVGVQITEALPDMSEVLSVTKSNGKFTIGEPYSITSAISLAAPQELFEAGTAYPAWVLDRYLQLPPDLPNRVGDLAARVTDEMTNPYQKTKTIENYLKETYPYNLRVNPPPYGSDGVDHFLFGLQEGYSEYFGSTMAVMLRTVGVPARLAVGYTTGDKVEGKEVYAVTDSHNHAWVEVYFPRFGWIPFEPTPGKALPGIYQLGAEEGGFLDTSTIWAEPLDEGCLDESDDCFGLGQPTSGVGVDLSTSGGSSLVSVWPWLLTGLAVLALGSVAISLIWTRFLATPSDPRIAFRRMRTLAALAKASQTDYQTPYQFGERLQQILPLQQAPVSIIVSSYVKSRYANKTTTASEKRLLAVAWRKLRFPMLWRAFRCRIC